MALNSQELSILTALAIAPPLLAALAALMCLHPASHRHRGGPLALAIGFALAAMIVVRREGAGVASGADPALLTWSPLGLYGVTLHVQVGATSALMAIPGLIFATVAAVVDRRRPLRATVSRPLGRRVTGGPALALPARASDAVALVALGGSLLAVVAGDLLSLLLGTAVFLLGTTGAVTATAGAAQGGRRLLLSVTAVIGLLTCVLILGKINGHFQISQLSTTGFTPAAFWGLALAAVVVAPLPPFHGWLVRMARHPMAPALAAAAAATTLSLLLLLVRTTGGTVPAGWQRTLLAVGWLAALVGFGIGLIRPRTVLRLAALFTARAGLLFLAAAIATPAAMAAALLYLTVTLPALGVLWVIASNAHHPRPRSATRALLLATPAAEAAPGTSETAEGVNAEAAPGTSETAEVVAPLSSSTSSSTYPSFKDSGVFPSLSSLERAAGRPPAPRNVVATRTGVTPAPSPGTAATATSTPGPTRTRGGRTSPRTSYGALRRPAFWIVALLLASAAGLPGTVGGVAKGALVGALTAWPLGNQILELPHVLLDVATLIAAANLVWRAGESQRLRGRAGWLLAGVVAGLVIGPVIAPQWLIAPWLSLAATGIGVQSSVTEFEVSRIPTAVSSAIGLLTVWATVQHLRGQEWLPGPLRALLGGVALAWILGRRGWRRQGRGRAPAAAAASIWARIEALSGGLVGFLGPLEERYYAAAAVMLAVALIYVIGR